jgi:enoyl-CoA hydratase/carnithine racemase
MRTLFPSEQEPWYELSRRGQIFILTMQNNDNRLDYQTVAAMMAALDEVERVIKEEDPGNTEPWALITTNKGRIYSNGLNLGEVLQTMPDFLINHLHPFFLRVLTFPIPTVAAINGHAFAGGCMFAMVHDYRVMCAERGYICMNEIEMPAPLTPGMAAIIRSKFDRPAMLRNCLLEAHRFAGKEAVETGLVDAAVSTDKVLDTAIEIAEARAKFARAGPVMAMMKRDMYPEVVAALTSSDLGSARILKL